MNTAMDDDDKDLYAPGPSRAGKSSAGTSRERPIIPPLDEVSCIFCNGLKGDITAHDRAVKVSRKGIVAIKKACQIRLDEAATRILNTIPKNWQTFPFKFHAGCRSSYTNEKSISTIIRKRKLEDTGDKCDDQPLAKRVARSETKLFDWDLHCFICGKLEDKKRKDGKHSLVNMMPVSFREKILACAVRRSDEIIIQRLTFDLHLSCKNARYHRKCQQMYCSENNIQAAIKKKSESIYDRAAEGTFAHFQSDLNAGQIFPLPLVCSKYRQLLIEEGMNADIANQCRTATIRAKITKMFEKDVSIHSQTGNLPGILCAKTLTIGQLYSEINALKSRYDEASINEDISLLHTTSPEATIRLAASIIKEEIQQIPTTEYFHSPSEVSLDASEKFVPKCLSMLLRLIIDPDAFDKLDAADHETSAADKRRYLTLGECIIYSARRVNKKTQVIPPFHLGLMAMVQHEFGSRSLIDTLHCYGLCASYYELRSFLTTIANNELSKNEDVYLPSGLLHREKGGRFIQEGDDNVDINVQTIDGKNTYHVMARVLFQNQDADKGASGKESIRLKRSSDKTLTLAKERTTKMIHFQKPTARPEPDRNIGVYSQLKGLLYESNFLGCSKDLAWVLLRQVHRPILPEIPTAASNQTIPFWTGFNTSTGTPITHKTIALYLPAIDAKPADLTTVHTTLIQGNLIAKKCGQAFHVHTFDQQLYAVAQQIKISRPDAFPNLIIRLGGFHNLCTFIACIGKIWGDGGLVDLLCDSGAYAPNTVHSMLAGKQFFRAVRGLTLVYEALMCIRIKNCLQWIQKTKNDAHLLLEELLNSLTAAYQSDNCNSPDCLKKLIENIEHIFFPIIEEFRQHWRARSPTFAFWDNLITALEIMLLNIRAEREGNWAMHIQTQVNMLPYFFACNRPNYSRWATYYAVDMLSTLPSQVQQEFDDGHFAVNFSSGSFRGLWTDMAVEMSVIRDTKGGSTGSGIVGFTLKESAVLRWTLTRHILGNYSKEMKLRAGETNTPFIHDQEKASRIIRDEKDMLKILTHLTDNITDPFSTENTSEVVLNISSGLAASKEISTSLVNAVEIGKTLLKDFVETRLEPATEPEKKFFADPIKRSSLETFQNMQKTTNVILGSKSKQVLISSETIYQRALILAKARPEVNLAMILSLPMGAVPPALFKEDGTRRTTTKSDLLHSLEGSTRSSVQELPQCPAGVNTAYIVDAMAVLQRMNTKNMPCFNDVGTTFLNEALAHFSVASEVHVIFDRYDDPESTKNEERLKRQGSSGHRYHIAGGRPVPDWKHVMTLDENKRNLTVFLSNFIESHADKIPAEKTLYLAGGYEDGLVSKSIADGKVSMHNSLFSNQKEADTRIILHAMHCNSTNVAAETIGRIIVQTPDTDVMILLLKYVPAMEAIETLWMETGVTSKTTNLRRFIPIHEIALQLGNFVCSALPAIHALTGCDAVSSFYGIGKKKVMKQVLKMSEDKLSLIANFHLGNDTHAVEVAREFVASLYDQANKFKAQHGSLNDMRVKMSTTKATSVLKLPPSEASFLQHVKRAAWQCSTWTTAHEKLPQIPSPVDHGWQKVHGATFVSPVYYTGPCVTEKLGDFFCTCKTKLQCSKSTVCNCNRDGLGCTEVCRCNSNCHNAFNYVDPEEDQDET